MPRGCLLEPQLFNPLELNWFVTFPSLRLEHLDSYQTTFDAAVTALRESGALWVALDQSLFYPESGGQPADTGTLSGYRVADVQKRDGSVWHRLEPGAALAPGSTPSVGESVAGEINWARRYRHMQRHSGQHLLSQAFLRVNPAFETRSVSLTSEVCTLDLAGEPSEADCAEAEQLVNAVCYRNLAVRAFEVDEDDLGNYALRRPPKVSGRVRLVEMGDWELSACGGTHLRSTAEALPIKVLGAERVKRDLVRVRFSVGLEALDDYLLKHRVVADLGRALSAPPADLIERVAALDKELNGARQTLQWHLEQRAERIAEALLAHAQVTKLGRVVSAQLEPALLQPVAAALCKAPDVVALLGSADEERATLLFMRGSDAAADMNSVLREVLPLVEGRGGGKADRAQGGGKAAGLAAALEQAAKCVAGGKVA